MTDIAYIGRPRTTTGFRHAEHYGAMSDTALAQALDALATELERRGIGHLLAETAHERALARLSGEALDGLARSLDATGPRSGIA